MSGLDPRYVTSKMLEENYVDIITGEPLAGGRLFFYKDNNRTDFKTVFTLSGDAPNYSYVALPNPVNLSSSGSPVDVSGNNIKIYYFPFDEDGNQELYYVIAQDSSGGREFTRGAQPNPETNASGEDITQFNYIPNGQFLSHTTPPNNLLVGGENFIAQGGFVIELPPVPGSANTVKFVPINFTTNPSQSPRYEMQLDYVASTDTFKNIGIRFNDVNKFSATDSLFTFAFWGVANVNVPISIQIFKFCGTLGTIVPAIVKATDVITTTGVMHQYQFTFDSNAAYTIDTVANNDYVQINIALPPAISPSIRVSDFALVAGAVNLNQFPLQTNADMIARGVFGWTDVPKGDGSDLGLSPILTQYGMTWSGSAGNVAGDVGDGGWSFGAIVSPFSVSPINYSNKMPTDGAQYPFDGHAVNGIPFSRLGNFLLANSAVPGVPMFGTGPSFVTCYPYATELDRFRLSVNSPGTPILAASPGTTGWNVAGIVTYGVSTTGSATFNYASSNTVADTVLCAANFVTPFAAAGAGTSGFTVTVVSGFTGLLAEQNYGFTVLCVSAATLTNGPGNNADYWLFSSNTVNYYMWFVINGEIDPLVAGRTGIRINLQSSYTAQDVANIVREVIQALQESEIQVTTDTGTGLLPGQYWLFQTNPAAPLNYYAYQVINGVGVDPMVPGALPIRVELTTAQAADVDQIALVNWQTVNKQFYAAPFCDGMVPRGVDFSGRFDLDVAQRWSNVSGLSGANFGTFEYQQLLSHNHQTVVNGNRPAPVFTSSAGGNALTGAGVVTSDPLTIDNTGGTETRMVNFFANFYIRY